MQYIYNVLTVNQLMLFHRGLFPRAKRGPECRPLLCLADPLRPDGGWGGRRQWHRPVGGPRPGRQEGHQHRLPEQLKGCRQSYQDSFKDYSRSGGEWLDLSESAFSTSHKLQDGWACVVRVLKVCPVCISGDRPQALRVPSYHGQRRGVRGVCLREEVEHQLLLPPMQQEVPPGLHQGPVGEQSDLPV